MKQPDYEFLHQVKGQLKDTLTELGDYPLTRLVESLMRKKIEQAEQVIDKTIYNLADDLCYLRQMAETVDNVDSEQD